MYAATCRGLDKAVVRSLGTGHWVGAKQNVIVIGMTGTGKSYLGAALAEAACRHGYRALRTRVRAWWGFSPSPAPTALHRHAEPPGQARRPGARRLPDRPLNDSEPRDLLEVLEDRYDQRSTVVTSQVPTKAWHEMLASPPSQTRSATAGPQRHVLSLKGPSIRK